MSLVDGGDGDGDGDVVHPLLAAEVGGPGDGGITSLGLQHGGSCRDVAKKKGRRWRRCIGCCCYLVIVDRKMGGGDG